MTSGLHGWGSPQTNPQRWALVVGCACGAIGCCLLASCCTPSLCHLRDPLCLNETLAQVSATVDDASSAPEPCPADNPAPVTRKVAHSSDVPAPEQVNKTTPAPATKTAPDPGESPDARTMAEVLQLVLQHHPALCLWQREVEAAQAQLITARLLPNPQFVINADPAMGNSDRTSLSGRVMFTVPLGAKRQARTAAACAALNETRWEGRREVRLLLLEAADAAIEVQYLQELVGLHDQLARSAAEQAENQKDRFGAAATPYRNVILAALTAQKEELARRDSAAQLAQAQVRLCRAMGSAETTTYAIRGQVAITRLTFPPVEMVLGRVSEVAPELARSQAAVLQSQRQLALERWNAVPDPAIGPRLRSSWSDTGDEFVVGGRLAVDLPVFDRNQGKIAAVAAELGANCVRRKLAEVVTLSDVQASYLALQEVQTRWEYFQQHVQPLIEQTEVVLRDSFRERAMPANEIVDLLEAFARMRLNDLQLRYQHQRLRTRLELLLQCPLCDLAVEASTLQTAGGRP